MKYTHKQLKGLTIEAEEVKENTTLEHPEYGEILVTPGNYIVTYLTGPNEGEKVGMAKADLELQYKQTKK